MDNVFIKVKAAIWSPTRKASVSTVQWRTTQPISVWTLSTCNCIQSCFCVINLRFALSFAVIDVASGEYGHEFIDKMISVVDNGRCLNWTPYDAIAENNYRNEKLYGQSQLIDELEEEINPKHLRARSSTWEQFWTLYKRRTIQMWRDSVGLLGNGCNSSSFFSNVC